MKSINDKAATATAIIAIATAIANILPLTSLAPSVAIIITANNTPRIVTAATPCFSALILIKPSNTHTPAIMDIATDAAKTVPATFAIC